jgi:dihydroorotase
VVERATRTTGAARPSAVVLQGGTVIDQTGDRVADVLVVGDRVTEVGPIGSPPKGARVLDAGGCVVTPGLVDLHTHLRQPGREEAETVESGARAAALGGFTAVVAMPNTEPTLDSAEAVRTVQTLAERAMATVAVAGAITVGRAGERLAPMAELAELGVRIFTDDGSGVQSAGLMRRALEYANGLGVTLAQHCEDASLAGDGAMHEGAWSSRLGIPGLPALAEEVMVARDLALVRDVGGRIHFLHLSTAGSVELVRRAKAEGLAVTAEAAPHHFTLTDACAADYDPVFKVNPPLRPASDVDAVKAGLADGTIDAIATDHAPHPPEAKDLPFDQAPPGMLGLQTALALAITELDLPLGRILALMSWQPAAICGLDPAHGGDQGGPVVPGSVANLCVIDPSASWIVDPAGLASRSRNSPYFGRKLTGQVRHTVFRGDPVVVDAEAQR